MCVFAIGAQAPRWATHAVVDIDAIGGDLPLGTHDDTRLDVPGEAVSGHCALCHWMVTARAAWGLTPSTAPAPQAAPVRVVPLRVEARSAARLPAVPSRAPPA